MSIPLEILVKDVLYILIKELSTLIILTLLKDYVALNVLLILLVKVGKYKKLMIIIIYIYIHVIIEIKIFNNSLINYNKLNYYKKISKIP